MLRVVCIEKKWGSTQFYDDDDPEDEDDFVNIIRTTEIDCLMLGSVEGKDFVVDGEIYCTLGEAKEVFSNALSNMSFEILNFWQLIQITFNFLKTIFISLNQYKKLSL